MHTPVLTPVQTPVQCPYVLTLHRFLTELGARVPRAEVRSVLGRLPTYPRVTVKEVIQVLETWQIPALAFKAKTHVLPKLGLPLLAFIRNEFEGYFVMITRLDGETITYYSPVQGEVTEPLAGFESRWSGVILAASTDEMSGPLPVSEAPDAETEAARHYREHSVKLIENFFSPEECRYLIDYAERNGMFYRSEVDYGDGKASIVPTRTSYSAGLKDRTDPVLARIYDRVSRLLEVPDAYIENLQCVRYGEGEEFKPHFDAGASNHRVHTLLVYLNDDFAHGETYFPELDLKVKPKAGMALYFLNRNDEGEILLPSAHAGLPVKQGLKYGCNIWVRDRPYEGIAAEPAEAAAPAH